MWEVAPEAKQEEQMGQQKEKREWESVWDSFTHQTAENTGILGKMELKGWEKKLEFAVAWFKVGKKREKGNLCGKTYKILVLCPCVCCPGLRKSTDSILGHVVGSDPPS